MNLLKIYSAMLGSTYKRIQRERAEGHPVMLCPHCGRLCFESDLALIRGELMCVGDNPQTCCALRYGKDQIIDSYEAVSAAWQELELKMRHFFDGELSYAEMGVRNILFIANTKKDNDVLEEE